MSFKIIDAHMHMGPSTGRMVPDYSIESIIDLMDHLGIEKAISANGLSLSDQFEAGLADDFLANEKSGGRIYSFFGYGPKYIEESLACIRNHKDDKRCVGIKLHPAGSRTKCDDESFRPAWEIARELGLPIMSHTWDVSTYNPNQIYGVAALFEKYIAEYPEVTFVFGHCGGRYNGIKQAIEIGKKYPNAHYDITGDIAEGGTFLFVGEKQIHILREHLIEELLSENAHHLKTCQIESDAASGLFHPAQQNIENG